MNTAAGDLTKKGMHLLNLILFFIGFQSQANDQNDFIKIFRAPEHKMLRLEISDKPLSSQLDVQTGVFSMYAGVFVSSQFASETRHELKFHYYRADKIGTRPLVLVLPPIIGSTPIDRIVAETLAKNEVDVIVPEFGPVLRNANSLEVANQTVTGYLIALRLLIKEIVNEPSKEIDSNKVGVYGMSLGAVIASVMVGLSEDVTHAYIVNGGGNLGEISQYSEQTIVKNFRQRVMDNKSMQKEEWIEAVKKNFLFEPLHFARYTEGKKIFMVMCKSDLVIPYKNQIELWNALSQPAFMTSTFHSHVGTIIKWVIKSRYDLIDFMQK